jgi:hypothetical protein
MSTKKINLQINFYGCFHNPSLNINIRINTDSYFALNLFGLYSSKLASIKSIKSQVGYLAACCGVIHFNEATYKKLPAKYFSLARPKPGIINLTNPGRRSG